MTERIVFTDIVHEMRDSYMEYAMSVIVGRALPDVRDGLKPVHRRVLYAMQDQGNHYNKPYRKSARVVGDVIGKYHPHGDSAVYDTIVRLTQPFSMRYPLIDGQGNFGSVDGDAPAAMRYTEVRMRLIAHELMSDLDKGTVNFIPNYDESQTEPVVLPTRIPNLLVNGSTGIAVGMACNIPPHNLGEVMDAFLYYIDHRYAATLPELMEFLPGPDFPTGGTIMGRKGIYDAYTTGKGIVRIRAKAHFEETKEGRDSIIVTELPYMVNKAMLLERIADMVRDKRLEGITDLRDESDRKGMRIFIQVRRGDDPNVVLSNLYKHTALQSSFGITMLAIVDRQPKVLSLAQTLEFFLSHRIEVVTRRTQHELEQARKRMHLLEGLMIALANLDAVLEDIRQASNGGAAQETLMQKYELSQKQAQAILDMRLQRLTGMEQDKIRAEHADVSKAITDYEDILSKESRVLEIIREESRDIRDRYRDERRSEIVDDDSDILIEDLITEEDMAVTFSHAGYVKRTAITEYRVQRRGGMGVQAATTKDGDFVEQMFVASTHDHLLFFTNTGRIYSSRVYELPQASRTSRGKAVVNVLELQANETVRICLVVPKNYAEMEDLKHILMCTSNGICKKIEMLNPAKIRRTGIRAITLDEGDSLISATLTDGQRELFFATHFGIGLRVHESTIRSMGRDARGVIGIRLADGDRVVSALTHTAGNLLTVTERGYGKQSEIDAFPLSLNRGNKGVRTMKVSETTGRVVAMLEIVEGQQLLLITQTGRMIRIHTNQVPIYGRVTQGSRLIRLNEGEQVIAVAPVTEEDASEEEDAAATEETTAEV
jgi:DNA gyrase subunit A